MTLTQLRYLCEISRHGLHLSRAAEVLFTSQPGVSRQIRLLEDELGVVIFNRRRNRILGLTQPGEAILRFAENVLKEAENIKNIGQEYKGGGTGDLVIATTHTQARYRLPKVIRIFMKRFPDVRMEFWQGNQQAAFQRVESGEADLAIGTDPEMSLENVVLLPCGAFSRNIITQPKHPLLKYRKVTLEMVAEYPIITHAFDSNGRWKLAHYFENRSLKPNIVFRATDTDICKAYVELGVGIALMADIAYDRKRDKYLRAIRTNHLFAPERMFIGLNRRQFYRHYIFEFIEMFAPDLKRAQVERALQVRQESDKLPTPPKSSTSANLNSPQ